MKLTDIVKTDTYEVINPNTSKTEEWSGERLHAFMVNSGATVELSKPKKEKKVKKESEPKDSLTETETKTESNGN